MKHHLSSKITAGIFSTFPFLLLSIFFPFEASLGQFEQSEDVIELRMDSMITDTIITFDPVTKEESISFVTRAAEVPSIFEKNAETFQKIKAMGTPGRIDTVIIFDQETKKEAMYIIEN